MADKSVTTKVNNWNFNTNHVQQNLNSGNFTGSHSTLLCATVPRLEMLSGKGGSSGESDSNAANTAIPIGIVSDFSMQQQAQLQELYEIGSKRKYTVVSGRTSNMLSLNRVEYDGPSLLRMLYAYYPDAGLKADYTTENFASASGKINIPELDEMFKKQIEDAPGYKDFWINLMSTIFTRPFGLLMIQENVAREKRISSTFFENCYVASHQIGVSAGAVVLAESSQLTFDRVVPLKVDSEVAATNS